MKRFVLTVSAKRDIDEIWLYIVEQGGSIEAAERVIWGLHERIVNIGAHPRMGRACPEIDPEGRCSAVGNYIIYYRAAASRIVVTHVFHGKRDQKKAWKRR